MTYPKNKKRSFVDSRPFYRALEAIPALISWSIILLPVFISPFYPVPIAIFLVTFAFLWFLQTVEYTTFLLISFFKYRRALKRDYKKELLNWKTGENLSKKDREIREALVREADYIDPDRIKHIVLVATCGESFEILDETIGSVANSNFDNERIFLCLATEARMGQEGRKIAKRVEKKYKSKFGKFLISEHPDGLPNEVRGKGGNITCAGRNISKLLKKEKANFDEYVVTTLDADNKTHSKYLDVLTLIYAKEFDRIHKSYQPISLFFNNIWDVPIFNRMIAITGGFFHMVESARAYRLHNFSAHAQPLTALEEMDYWAVNTIVEDGHQFWRSYFHFDGEYEVIPLSIPIYQDAVLNVDFKSSLVAQYKQVRRWSWGCSDIPFVLYNWIKNFRKMPFIETALHFFRLMESHIFWATSAVIITLTTPVPEFLNADYARSIYSTNISHVLSTLFRVVLAGISISIFVTLLTVPKPPKKIGYLKLILQWALIPIVTIFFTSIPALESQTRLFLGKYLGFNITEKVRVKKKTKEQVSTI